MRKIGAYIVISALAPTIVSPSPVSAFGLYFGPFHIGFGHRYGHRLAHHPHYVAPSSDRARRQNIAKPTQADRGALAEINTQAAQSCGGLAPGVTNLPIEEIRQSVHPTADQEAVLDDLSAASSNANDIIKSSCPTAPPLTPVGRLGAAEQRLEAMIRAAQIVRSPLERLYDSLSDEQRRQFNTMDNSGKAEREPGSAPLGGDLATLCDQQAGGGFASLPVQRIEQVVRPNTQQQNALADLKRTSEDAASDLRASCPTQIPQTPVALLDAVATRLKARADAMKSVRSETRKLLCLTERRAEGEFQYHGFATAQPSEQWPVDCSRFHIGGPSGLATCDAIFARCLVRVTPTEIGRPSSVRTRRRIALAISATEEMGASRDIAKSLIDRDTLDERCKIIEHLDGGIA